MPSFIQDEHKWEKAKEIVRKEYGLNENDGDSFWALVMGVCESSPTYGSWGLLGQDNKKQRKGYVTMLSKFLFNFANTPLIYI